MYVLHLYIIMLIKIDFSTVLPIVYSYIPLYLYVDTLDYSVTNLVTLKIPPSPLDPRIEHHFDIEILDDFDVESAEYFICNITNTSIPCKPPKEGAFDIINENRLTIVNISDNDSKYILH